MTGFPYDFLGDGLVKTLVAYDANGSESFKMVPANHPNFEAILAGLRAGDPNVWSLFSFKEGVLSRFYQISERYAWDGNQVTFDGDPVHSTFTDLLTRALENGDERNYTAIARFGEKLASNPNEHSREQAYDWLESHKFQITDDGDVVGYKGVKFANGRDDSDGYRSGGCSEVRGKPSAFVNGLAVEPLSYVPQNIGDVVSMPRSEVSHNPAVSCARGLHVSTRSYAERWGRGGAVLTVFVNPRDIVSVPNGESEKVRACRYKVSHVASESLVNDHSAPVLRADNQYTWAGDVGYRGV
jgi:hypothetical protein